MRIFISGKIHGIRVSGKSVNYTGSATVDQDLMRAAGMLPYEQVQIVNITNGNRWVTYLLPGEKGEFLLNGAAARLGEVGDECIIMSFAISEDMQPAKVVFCNPDNTIAKVMEYRL